MQMLKKLYEFRFTTNLNINSRLFFNNMKNKFKVYISILQKKHKLIIISITKFQDLLYLKLSQNNNPRIMIRNPF